MDDAQRAILAAVAAGKLSPEEAAVRLDPEMAQSDDAGGSASSDDRATQGGGDNDPQVVRVQAAGRHVRVVGDDRVDKLDVEGLHEARQEGDAVVVSAQRPFGEGGFSFAGPPFGKRAWKELRSLTRGVRATREVYRPGRPARDWSWDWSWEWPQRPGPPGTSGGPAWVEWHRFFAPLVVRVNPELAVEVELSAGSCILVGLRSSTRVDVCAGTANLRAMEGQIDVRAQAASVRIEARLAEGSSRVRCEAGSVVVALDPGSDVRVRTQTELGRVRMRPSARRRGRARADSGDELVLGRGTATLNVDAVMGSVDVEVGEGAAEAARW